MNFETKNGRFTFPEDFWDTWIGFDPVDRERITLSELNKMFPDNPYEVSTRIIMLGCVDQMKSLYIEMMDIPALRTRQDDFTRMENIIRLSDPDEIDVLLVWIEKQRETVQFIASLDGDYVNLDNDRDFARYIEKESEEDLLHNPSVYATLYRIMSMHATQRRAYLDRIAYYIDPNLPTSFSSGLEGLDLSVVIAKLKRASIYASLGWKDRLMNRLDSLVDRWIG